MRFLKTVKKKLHNKRGASLAEMLVCVVLVGFISMIVCTGILMSFKTTDDVSQVSYAMTVSDTIMNHITGDITECSSQLSSSGIYLAGLTDSPVIGFIDKSDVPEYIAAFEKPDIDPANRGEIGSGYLMKYYCRVTDSGSIISNEASWAMDPQGYMDYSIESLRFSYTGNKGNCPKIRIDLRLKDISSGRIHETSRIVCCYNIDNRYNDRIYADKSAEQIVNSLNFTV